MNFLAALAVLVAISLAFVAGWVLRADVEQLNRRSRVARYQGLQ